MQEVNVYLYLTPIALAFIITEVFFSWYLKRGYITFTEAMANFGTALANQTTNVLLLTAVLYTYGYLWEHYRIFTIELTWWSFILLLLGIDFVFYWVHRFGHEINILWAAHSPHHSAEEMNFFVAVRASVTQRLSSFMFFWVLTIVGFSPIHIYTMTGLHLFIAFLHHTEFIPKLWRPIEFIFTTPSHHRVHHGVNFQYLDKNYGEFLIIWDRMFGTFAEEKEKVVYGIYDHPKSWNPVAINFHFYKVLWNYARETPYLWDKLRVWVMPAGWRPRGLPQKEMIEITSGNQVKFRPEMFAKSKFYFALQSVLGIALMIGVISKLYGWSVESRWIAGILLWWQIINWSGILEAKAWLWISETLRNIATPIAVLIFSQFFEVSPISLSIVLISLFAIIWTNLFFRPNSQTLSTA
jgi:alkylglycerol monooxygenase